MAKYSITHSCGHVIEHQLFGKHSGFGGRDSKLEWLETQPCLGCKRKEDEEARQAQNEEARIANAAVGASPLLGSERQVAWAETIRRQTLVSFLGAYDRVKAAPEPNLVVEAEIKSTISWLFTRTEAGWWIETIGTLKSREGMAPLFGMLDGKFPKASEGEILRHVILESPVLSEEGATALGLGEQYRARVTARAAIAGKAEMIKELEATKPVRPQVLQDARAKFGANYNWNGKLYSGRRIFVSNTEIRLTVEQEKEILEYNKARADHAKRSEILKG